MNQYISWIIGEITYICKTYKKRTSGSAAEVKSAEYMESKLRDWADEVNAEDFTLHPKAFMGSIPFQAFCALCSVALFWLSIAVSARWLFAISAVFALCAALSWAFEYVLYRRFMDWLYPKKRSKNVFSIRKAEKKTTQRIVICGHVDAAYEFPLLLKLKITPIYILMLTAI